MLFKWPNKKSRQDLYEIFLNLQHYFAAGALTNITLLSSAAPSFSKNISIFEQNKKMTKMIVSILN